MEHRLVTENQHMAWQFMIHKLFHRRMVRVTEWYAKFYISSYLAEDGVILIPSVYEFASMFPIGLCECGACGAFWLPDQHDRMYWDNDELMIVCRDCNQTRNGQTVMMMCTDTSMIRGDPTVQISFEEHIDTLAALETAHSFAERFAIDLKMHYFGGKDTRQLYQDFLAKRVVRRWRNMMNRRLRQRLAWVLEEKLSLGRATCTQLAQNVLG